MLPKFDDEYGFLLILSATHLCRHGSVAWSEFCDLPRWRALVSEVRRQAQSCCRPQGRLTFSLCRRKPSVSVAVKTCCSQRAKTHDIEVMCPKCSKFYIGLGFFVPERCIARSRLASMQVCVAAGAEGRSNSCRPLKRSRNMLHCLHTVHALPLLWLSVLLRAFKGVRLGLILTRT